MLASLFRRDQCPEFAALYLAGAAAGEFLEEDDVSRHLVVGQAVPHMLLESFRCR